MRFLKMLWKCIAVWNVKPASEGDLRTAKAIFAYSKSKMKDGTPGRGNEIIAGTVKDLGKKFDLPVFAQEEVALADPDLLCEYVARYYQDGKSHLDWNTATITDLFMANGGNRLKKVIVASGPEHLPRVVMVVERRNLKVVAAPMPKNIGQYSHKDLSLWAERGGKFRFRFRDFFVRILFLLQGNI